MTKSTSAPARPVPTTRTGSSCSRTAVPDSQAPGVAAANAALGLFDTYSELGQRAYTPFRSNMWEWFAQDSWKASQKLNVTFGVRHTINFPYEAHLAQHVCIRPLAL